MNKPLDNEKHEAFAHLVAKGMTPPKAYVLAGYREKGAVPSASRLLKNVNVLLRIEQLRESIVAVTIQKTAIEKAWVLTELVEVVKLGKERKAVTVDGVPLKIDDKLVESEPTNLAAANKALELIGKEIGMFIERSERGKPGDFSNLSEEELLRRIDENNERIRKASELTSTAIGNAKNAAGIPNKAK